MLHYKERRFFVIVFTYPTPYNRYLIPTGLRVPLWYICLLKSMILRSIWACNCVGEQVYL
nr:MAG TPA: hypothetical protein [Bacteriophage sp.]